MKYYPVVLVVLRFVAVFIVLIAGFQFCAMLFGLWQINNRDILINPSAGVMVKAGKQAVLGQFIVVVTGVVLYLLAPLLSSVITYGSDSGSR